MKWDISPRDEILLGEQPKMNQRVRLWRAKIYIYYVLHEYIYMFHMHNTHYTHVYVYTLYIRGVKHTKWKYGVVTLFYYPNQS